MKINPTLLLLIAGVTLIVIGFKQTKIGPCSQELELKLNSDK